MLRYVADAPAGHSSRRTIEKLLDLRLLVLRDLGTDGVTFAGNLSGAEQLRVEMFEDAADYQALSLRGSGLSCLMLDEISATLVRAGWAEAGKITHPFLMRSFFKEGAQVRVEHNGINPVSLEMLSFKSR